MNDHNVWHVPLVMRGGGLRDGRDRCLLVWQCHQWLCAKCSSRTRQISSKNTYIAEEITIVAKHFHDSVPQSGRGVDQRQGK